MTFADHVINFNKTLRFNKKLPDGIRIMNPFRENPNASSASEKFYRKFYNDNNKRSFILGINPGRFGAGATGIPFTDTKRLSEICSIKVEGLQTHEPSSVFIYKLAEVFGGVHKFYSKFYINSVCPLGFVKQGKSKKEINYNYYDNKLLYDTVKAFIVQSIKKQIQFGMNTEVCYCLGNGKNFYFLSELNGKHRFFKEIIPFEHPRFIVQYRQKKMHEYIDRFVELLIR